MEKLGASELERALGRKRRSSRQQTDREIGAALYGWLKTSEELNDLAGR